MNVLVTTEAHFDQAPDRSVWNRTAFARSFWTRYAEVFDDVRILARIRPVGAPPSGAHRVDGPGIGVCTVPDYTGVAGFIRCRTAVAERVRDAVQSSDALIFRVPSQLAMLAARTVFPQNRPYGLEVVGDPYDVFSNGAVNHPLSPAFRLWFARGLKSLCSRASGVAYVSEGPLPRRYPPGEDSYTTYYSSIELDDLDFALAPRTLPRNGHPVRIITVASLAQRYKGIDYLIRAVARCSGPAGGVRLAVAGGGRIRAELESLASRLGISGRVTFLGELPGRMAVRDELDKSDLFVLPSLTEGLPRAMIEAMARGLPCIGSTAGSIPALLPPEDMVPPRDPSALAAKILEVLSDPDRAERMSRRNMLKARDYSDAVLNPRRVALYSHLRAATQQWLATVRPAR